MQPNLIYIKIFWVTVIYNQIQHGISWINQQLYTNTNLLGRLRRRAMYYICCTRSHVCSPSSSHVKFSLSFTYILMLLQRIEEKICQMTKHVYNMIYLCIHTKLYVVSTWVIKHSNLPINGKHFPINYSMCVNCNHVIA